MFSQNNLSKADLITRLNTITLKMSKIINKLSSPDLKEALHYLLSVTSQNDPCQFSNMSHTIDEAFYELNRTLGFREIATGIIGMSLSLSILGSQSQSRERQASSQAVGWISGPLALYGFYLIHDIKKEISKLNKLKKIIENSIPYNERLANMIREDELLFRKEFYKQHIQTHILEEKQDKKDKKSNKGSFFYWDLSKSFLPKLGYATLPGGLTK